MLDIFTFIRVPLYIMPNANVILNNSHKQILFHTNSDWLDNLIRFESFMNYDKHSQYTLQSGHSRDGYAWYGAEEP